MRLLYWLDYKLHGFWVGIGDWAWKKPHRPFIVWIATCTVIAVSVTGGIELLEALTDHQ